MDFASEESVIQPVQPYLLFTRSLLQEEMIF